MTSWRPLSLAVALAVVALPAAPALAARPSGHPAPRPVVFMQPGYQLVGVVESSIRTNGVRLRGRIRPVTSVTCEGLGIPGAKRHDAVGFLELTYHRFSCDVTTPSVRRAQAIVQWWSNNTYRYDFPLG